MPTCKITQRTLASVDPTGKRYFIRDADLIGFGIEVTARGKATYVVETRIKGRGNVVRKQLGSIDHLPLNDARQEARKNLLEAKRGTDIRFSAQEEEPLPDTLGAALEAHLKAKRHTMRPATASDYRKTFQNALSDWKDLPIKQLSKGMVAKRYTELLGRYSGAYVDKIFRNLSSTLAFHGVNPNPCKIISDKGLRAPVVAHERALRGNEGERVFGFTDASNKNALDKFKERVRFHDDWNIHDLRRTFAADLQLVGYSEAEIGIALNHSAGTVTGRHYRGGTRNKSWLLSHMYGDLQEQHGYYQYNDGDLDELRPMPRDWQPFEEPSP